MKQYLYYPGCSAKGTGRAYEESLLAVFQALDLSMTELDDWNCCGATAYMAVDEAQSIALAARNLAIAESSDLDLVAPCNACWLVLLKAQIALRDNPDVRAVVGGAMEEVGLHYKGSVNIRHPLDVLVNDVGVDALKAKVVEPLGGLKVAPYYGCQIVRPHATFDDQNNPTTMDRILTAAGAKVVDFTDKTRCCGGSQTGTMPDIGLHLVRDLLQSAHAVGAQAIATVCPLCQFNLEAFQKDVTERWHVEPLPVVYMTQLLGLSLGLQPEPLGLTRSLIPLGPVLERRTANAV